MWQIVPPETPLAGSAELWQSSARFRQGIAKNFVWGKGSAVLERGAGFYGGEGEIRTLDTVPRMPAFEAGRFNRSRTSPHHELQVVSGFGTELLAWPAADRPGAERLARLQS